MRMLSRAIALGWLFAMSVLAALLMFSHAQVAAQARCAPAEAVVRIFAAQRTVDLDAGQRAEFTAAFNAIPPETNYPAPERILLADDGARVYAFVSPPERAGVLCLVAVEGPPIERLIRKYLGTGA